MSRDAVLPLPPRSGTPETYYLDYLPRLWSAFFAGQQPPALSLAATARVGEDGYALRLEGGALCTATGPAPSPLVSFAVSPEDFKEQVRAVVPRLVRYTERHLQRARDDVRRLLERPLPELERLRREPGRIEIVFTDDAGDVTRLWVSVGDGRGPVAHVHLADRDLWALLDERPASFLGTRLRVEGDLGYVLRLAALLRERA